MTENLGGLFGGAALGNLNLASASAEEAPTKAEVETDSTIHDVIIVGSGPAGYTAAIYAARASLKPVLFASSLAPGGSLMNTTEVENFPGFIQGIQGPELMDNIGQQAERFGTDIRYQDVDKVELTGDVKKVYTADGAVHLAKTVIMTTGSQVRKLNIEGEDRLSGYGVSWCATCDGFFFKDKEIAVVGGGDSALEEALFLTTFASKVYLVHRRDAFRASEIMQERVFNNPKIEVVWDSAVTAVHGESNLEAVTLTNTKDGSESRLEVQGLFIAIGSGSGAVAALDAQHYLENL